MQAKFVQLKHALATREINVELFYLVESNQGRMEGNELITLVFFVTASATTLNILSLSVERKLLRT